MTQTEEPERQEASGNQITDGLERVWSEIKQISKQVENETRRSGRSARLRLDIRRLRKEQSEVRARLGNAVYEALCEHGDEITLQQVEGFAGGVAALEALAADISAKETEINSLRDGAASGQPLEETEEVA